MAPNHFSGFTGTTITPSTNTVSAAQKVFDVAELFELVFQHLDLHDISRCKRVSQTFHIHIRESKPLQRKLAWLQIEPQSRTPGTFLDFRLYFPYHASHGPFSMGCEPRYSREGKNELLYLHFKNVDPAPASDGILKIVPEASGSWRRTRIANTDVCVCLTHGDEVTVYRDNGHKIMKAGTTLGDVYDWLYRRQEVIWIAIGAELKLQARLEGLRIEGERRRAEEEGGVMFEVLLWMFWYYSQDDGVSNSM